MSVKACAESHSALSSASGSQSPVPPTTPLPLDTYKGVPRRPSARDRGLKSRQVRRLNSGLPHRERGARFSRATMASTSGGTPGAMVSRMPLYEAAAANMPGWRAACAIAP